MAEINGHDRTRDDFVRITNREIYDGLRRLETGFDTLNTTMASVLEENVTLGKRVRALELRFYGVLAGLMASLTALGVGLGVS